MERIDLQRFMLRVCCSTLYHSSSDGFALLLHPVTSRRECSLFKMGPHLPDNCIFSLCTTCALSLRSPHENHLVFYFLPTFPSARKTKPAPRFHRLRKWISVLSLFASRASTQIRAKNPNDFKSLFLTYTTSEKSRLTMNQYLFIYHHDY